MDVPELVERLRKGEPRAIARALTLVENGSDEAQEILAQLFADGGVARIVGLTGAPGVGKSTLADALARIASQRGHRVAILAIDPTSPYTGGALLGDRARMDAGASDPNVFIRSMATRGHVGGLASAAFEALVLLEAAGKDFILLETVGAGQDEIEVAAAVDVTVVVLAPGLGDQIQASKAGLLEVADILVVNKADRDGADLLAEETRAHTEGKPVLETVARDGTGVEPVYEAILGVKGERRLLESWLWNEVQKLVRERLPERAWARAMERLKARQWTPHEAARHLLESWRP